MSQSPQLPSDIAELVTKLLIAGKSPEEIIASLKPADLVAPPVQSTPSVMLPLDEMISTVVGKRTNKHVIAGNFPEDAFGTFNTTGLVLIGGNRRYTTPEAEKQAKMQGRVLKGVTQALAYVKANPDALRGGLVIVCAKSTFKPEGALEALTVVVRLEDGLPTVGLEWDNPTCPWDGNCLFIAEEHN